MPAQVWKTVPVPVPAQVWKTAPESDPNPDAFTHDDDCDDQDPEIHPGADDTWYDGVDQDCAGNDDFDADADSFTRDEDCDDLDPTRAADCAADSGLPAPKSCGCASAPPRPGLLIFALALLFRRRS